MSRSRQRNEKTWQDKVIELLNKMAEKLEKLDKLDEIKEAINNLPDRTVMTQELKEIKEAINSLPDRMVEELYGKETVNWGSLVIQSRMQEEGFKMSEIKEKEEQEIKKLKKSGEGKKIDEVLVFSNGEKRKVFFIEGKHTLNSENFKKALEQLEWAVKVAREGNFDIVKDAEIILAVSVKTKNDSKDLTEYFNEAQRRLKEIEGVSEFWFIMEDGRIEKERMREEEAEGFFM